MTNPTKILKAIKKHKRFIVTSHANADPDALCSELVIAQFLHALGKKVVIVNDDKVPQRYQFISGVKKVKTFTRALKIEGDAVIIVDLRRY